LFSAVVTAFVIESYQLLQPDQQELTVLALTSLSQQLQVLITGTGAPATFKVSRNITDASTIALNAVSHSSVVREN
jgi:hypothetical protein